VLFFHADIHLNVIAFVVMFLVGTTSFAAIGYMIAALSKTLEGYMGIANIISFVMMFLSGIFFDNSMLPSFIQPIAAVMPLTYFANGIRDQMVYGLSVLHAGFWLNIGILLGWMLVTFFIGSRFFRWKA